MSARPWAGRLVLVALLFAAAASIRWIAPLRPTPLHERSASLFIVTNAADSGPGSLRDALFAAARAQGSARIHIAVAHIGLETPLPPAAQAIEITIEADAPTVIDARALGTGPVLDIEAPRASVRNVTVEHAAGIGFLVHSEGVELTGIAVYDSDIGLTVVGNSPYIDMHNCTMSRNRVGVQIAAPIAGYIHGCKFSLQSESSIWGVHAAGSMPRMQLKIQDNFFTGDRDAVVLGNLPVLVERNQFVGTHRNAITVLGSAINLRGNRIRDSAENGILLESADHIEIVDNEIGRSSGTGIMVKDSSAVSIERNQIYGNAYGIVEVLGKQSAPLTLSYNLIFSQQLDGLLIIGASPVINDNSSINNSGAGIRVLNVLRHGHLSVEAVPLLTRNVTAGNTRGALVRGTYAL